MAIQLQYRLLTVEEYHRMAETGILRPEDRVELLNGQIIEMSPIGSKHAACVEKLDKLLTKMLGEEAMVRAQNPVIINDHSEPEPDISVVRFKANFYAERHPDKTEVFLIIEVADSSLEKDRHAKLPIYAGAGIPEYWIINLEKQELEVYQHPAKDTYRSKNLYFRGDTFLWERFNLSLHVEELMA